MLLLLLLSSLLLTFPVDCVSTLSSLVSLTGGHHSPLADTLPDPVGRHPPGLAALLGLGQRVCGRGGVVVLHQVAVVRHKVAPQLVEVLNGGGQEELHPAEDVQQRLEGQTAEDTPPQQCEWLRSSK